MLSFLEDTAITVEAGTVLMLNAHYINTTSGMLEPEVRVNLHTIPKEDVKVEGGIFFWYDPFIRVPARSRATANMACTLGADVNITSMQSHMHSRGVGFEAVLTTPDHGTDMLYEFDGWEGVPVTHMDPGLRLEKGSRVRFDCHYDNSDDRDIYQGLKTTDEMCLFFGSYYPRAKGPTTSGFASRTPPGRAKVTRDAPNRSPVCRLRHRCQEKRIRGSTC